MKKLLRNRRLVERGEFSLKGRFPYCFISFSSEKHAFITIWNTLFFFFCLVNVHVSCNKQIYSFAWFTLYQKMIYYEIYFPLFLIFKKNFVKILLLMTFVSMSISLKTSNILENKSQVFERSDCPITFFLIGIHSMQG